MSFIERLRKLRKNNSPRRETCAALILAAGQSSRMKLEKHESKQFLRIGDMPLIARTMQAFEASPQIDEIVVVARMEDFSDISAIAREYGITKLKNIVAGGDTRADSALHGVLELQGRCDYVAIHDGARPFISPRMINETLEAAKEHGAAAPGIVPHDTIKRIGADNAVLETHERDTLRAVQTPQIFRYDIISRALLNVREKNIAVTDDCSAVEKLGYKVYITSGDERNIKITTSFDAALGEIIIGEEEGI